MKTYRDIKGWFDFESFYDRMVNEAQAPAEFVEVGCWMGKSTAYLAGRIAGSMKPIQLRVYDLFQGSDNEPALIEAAKATDVENAFRLNMAACGLFFRAANSRSKQDTPFIYERCDSVEAANRHPDKSQAFVFLDGCHTYEAVTNDIAAWRKKVRPGGILAGHDYHTYESVRQAVQLSIGGVSVEGNCWWVRL